MQLNKAIQTVARFAATGRKSPDLYQAVMLVPPVGDGPSWVFATDGNLSCMVPVGIPLPMALVPLDAIKAIAKHKLTSVERNGPEVTFTADGGGAFKAVLKDSIAYPRPPLDHPTMEEYPYWNHVWPIVHAVAGEKSKNPTFKSLRLRPTCVEATDAVRIAVADVPGWSEERLVPGRLLRGWRNGRLYLAFTDKSVWCRMGEEFRFAPLEAGGRFPDCKQHLPSEHTWPSLVLDTDRLRKTVQKAVTVSTLKTVALDFHGSELIIKSWNAEEGGKGFRAVLLGVPSGATPQAVKIINGKFLNETLRAVRTPRVRLCYQDQADGPLRVESGALVECLWPWRV